MLCNLIYCQLLTELDNKKQINKKPKTSFSLLLSFLPGSALLLSFPLPFVSFPQSTVSPASLPLLKYLFPEAPPVMLMDSPMAALLQAQLDTGSGQALAPSHRSTLLQPPPHQRTINSQIHPVRGATGGKVLKCRLFI